MAVPVEKDSRSAISMHEFAQSPSKQDPPETASPVKAASETRRRDSGVTGSQRHAFLARLGAGLAVAEQPMTVLAAALDEIVALCRGDAGLLLADPTRAGNFHCAARQGCVESNDSLLCGDVVARCGGEVAPVVASPADPHLVTDVARLFGRGHKEFIAVPLVGRDDASAVLFIACGTDADADFAGQRLFFLAALAAFAGFALESAELQARVDEAQGFGRDLESAAELQRSLQPDSDSAHLPIWGINQPARKVSGDFYDFFRLDDDRFAFALGDVSGKGMDAALLMAKTVSLFRCLGKRIEQPSALLEALNAELYETATRGMFVTMVAGQYCLGSGRLTFANAGHQPPLLRRPDRSYETFPAAAPPLGILPSTRFADEVAELANGEFYVFTDGLTEYRYSNGEELGCDGLIQLLEMHAGVPPAARLRALLDDLVQEKGWEVRDDLTLLAIDDAWIRTGGAFEPGDSPVAGHTTHGQPVEIVQ